MNDHQPAIEVLQTELDDIAQKSLYLQICLAGENTFQRYQHEAIRDHVRLRWQRTLATLVHRHASISNTIKLLEGE